MKLLLMQYLYHPVTYASLVQISTSAPRSQTPSVYVGFEVLTAVVMNVAIFWDIALCSMYVNQHFRGTCHSAYYMLVSC
jgi:hypothetical protein